MKIPGSRRVWIGAVTLLIALFLIRPGAGGFKSRVARSIGLAVGRQVEIGGMHLRLLPQPGFDLEDFVVHDDVAYSPEPMLRAQEVTAALRLTSLLRGHVEISRLNLNEPSVNLVRNAEGRWNIEDLVQRTARIAVAPTAKGRSEKRPGFPYIEADRGRINFKFGAEKKAWALTDADFALWQDSENAWSMRLKTQPLRTDFNLSDTGILNVEGTWQRSPDLHETPLNFTVEWSQAQLGQLTKLISGQDKGWRGAVSAILALSGAPSDLSIGARVAVQDFHRYDIIAPDTLQLAANCVAHYHSQENRLQEIICGAPVGDGTVRLQGDLSGVLDSHSYDLSLSAEDLPLQALINLARHSKRDLPPDLLAGGKLDGKLALRKIEEQAGLQINGNGEASGLTLRSTVTNTNFNVGRIPISLERTKLAKMPSRQVKTRERPGSSGPIRLAIGPLRLPLGRPDAARVEGWVDRTGYDLQLNGDSEIRQVLQLARTLGIPIWHPNTDGLANLNLRIAGLWSGFSTPVVTGTVRLSSVRAAVRGFNAPLAISSATLIVDPDETRVEKLTVSAGDLLLNGSLGVPRHCSTIATCPITFDLRTDTIDSDSLNALFNPNPPKRPWYRILSASAPGKSLLTELQAAGKISANRFAIKNLVADHVSARVQLGQGQLRLTDLRGDFLGGKHLGTWQADFTAKPPVYSGTGILKDVSLMQLAAAMKDGWISGTANAKYQLTFAGYSLSELLGSANGSAAFEMYDGALPHVWLTSDGGPIHVKRFDGSLLLHDGAFELKEGKLADASGIYQVSGTATMGTQLNIRITRDHSHSFDVGGTLIEPKVTPVSSSAAQADLKQ